MNSYKYVPNNIDYNEINQNPQNINQDEEDENSNEDNRSVCLNYKTNDLNEDKRKQNMANWLIQEYEYVPNQTGKKKDDKRVEVNVLINEYREQFNDYRRTDKALESELGKLVKQAFCGKVKSKRFGTGEDRYGGFRYLNKKEN